MTPWYLRKKMWVGLVTAVAMITSDLMNNPELATKILAIGMTVLGAFGLEDFGKAKQVVEEQAKLPPEVDTSKAIEHLKAAIKANPDLLN